jgi:hypothetical protein
LPDLFPQSVCDLGPFGPYSHKNQLVELIKMGGDLTGDPGDGLVYVGTIKYQHIHFLSICRGDFKKKRPPFCGERFLLYIQFDMT